MERLRRRNEKGFTLIELVLVIIILGILAAVAIPRFVRMREDAEVAVGNGIGGAMSGAISMLHAQYLLKNSTYNITSVVSQMDLAGGVGLGAGGDITIVATLTNGRTFLWTYTALDPVNEIPGRITGANF